MKVTGSNGLKRPKREMSLIWFLQQTSTALDKQCQMLIAVPWHFKRSEWFSLPQQFALGMGNLQNKQVHDMFELLLIGHSAAVLHAGGCFCQTVFAQVASCVWAPLLTFSLGCFVLLLLTCPCHCSAHLPISHYWCDGFPHLKTIPQHIRSFRPPSRLHTFFIADALPPPVVLTGEIGEMWRILHHTL